MALGESIVREGSEFLPYLIGNISDDSPFGHPGIEARPHLLHSLAAPLGTHRLTQLVGLSGCEAGHVDRHLHQLLLEQRDTEGLRQ